MCSCASLTLHAQTAAASAVAVAQPVSAAQVQPIEAQVSSDLIGGKSKIELYNESFKRQMNPKRPV